MTHQIETFIAWGQGELIRIFASIFLLAAALQFETWSCSKVSQVGQENWKCSCYSLSRIHGRRQKRHDRMATQREKHPFLSAFIQELPSALPLPPPPSLLLLWVFCFLFFVFFFLVLPEAPGIKLSSEPTGQSPWITSHVQWDSYSKWHCLRIEL